MYLLLSDGAKGTPRLVVSDPHPIPGDKVTFTCDLGNVTANPKTDRVKWTKDGDILGQAANWAEYVIERVNATHNGTYTCALGNEHGFSSDSIGVVMAANYSAFCKYITNLIRLVGQFSMLFTRKPQFHFRTQEV